MKEAGGIEANGFKDARILLIDDEPIVLKMMQDALVLAGYAPRALSDSRQALEAVENGAFDLLVTDIVMPHVHGLEILEAAKRRNPVTQVLFVTGYANREVVREGFKKGAWGFIDKPFKITDFLAAVDQALQGVSSNSEQDRE